MAKAREVEGIDCDDNFLEHATKTLRVRFDEIADLREKALDQSDIEGVHAMRVATRRLRSALRDFASLMNKKPLKKVSGEIKVLADTLGNARDQDVAILALEKLQKKAKKATVKDGIGLVIAERRSLRAKAQQDLETHLTAENLENLRQRFNSALDKAAAKDSSDNLTFGGAGSRIVGKSLKEFCKLTEHIYEPFVEEPLHELRIAAKRLRYAVELFVVCRGKPIEPFAAGVAEIQGFLGEIHDADVWLESLSRRMKNGEDSETNIWLLSEFVSQRNENYRATLDLWSKWKRENFIENLRETISKTDRTATENI